MDVLTSLPSAVSIPVRQRAAVTVLLCLLGATAFYNSLDVPLLHDDEAAIESNPQIRQPWRSDINDDVQSAATGRPVVLLSLAFNYALGEWEVPEDSVWKPLASWLGIGTGGLSVRGYHLFNVAVHILSAGVLFGLLWRTLSQPLAGHSGRQADAVDLAAIAAAIWLVHPLQVDAVTYVIQRTELMMGLCYLLTLYAAHMAWRATHAWNWSLAAVLFCAGGMLCKESMATAPLAVVLYDRVFLFADGREMVRRRWPLYAGLAACWLPLAGIISTGPRDQTVGFDLGVTWWEYGAAQLGMITHYLGLIFWPVELCFDYGRVTAVGTRELAMGAAVVGALLGATLWALRHRPRLGFAGALFFLLLAPSSSIVPIVTEVGAERRMHLPLVAVLVVLLVVSDRLLSYGLDRWCAGASIKVQRVARWFGAGLVVITLTIVTVQRNEMFRSDLTIWTDTVARVPGNCSAHNNLGRAYFERGRLSEAQAEFVSALQVPDCDAQVYGNLGKVLIEMGEIDAAERYFADIVAEKPRFWRAHEGLGMIHLRRAQWHAAVASFRRCVDNGYANADLHTNLGMALSELGELPAAASHMRAALVLDPDHSIARENLAYISGLLTETEP